MADAEAKPLTDKQTLWVEHYLGEAGGNATEAARLAGYEAPTQSGWENRHNPAIRAAIEERLAEAAMSAREVLWRLTEMASASLEDFVRITPDGKYEIDLEKARKRGKLHLLKKLSPTKFGTAIELCDVQAALEKLARFHALFTDKSEISGPAGSPVTITIPDNGRDAIEDIRERAAQKLARWQFEKGWGLTQLDGTCPPGTGNPPTTPEKH